MEWKIYYVVTVINSPLQAIHLITLHEEACVHTGKFSSF